MDTNPQYVVYSASRGFYRWSIGSGEFVSNVEDATRDLSLQEALETYYLLGQKEGTCPEAVIKRVIQITSETEEVPLLEALKENLPLVLKREQEYKYLLQGVAFGPSIESAARFQTVAQAIEAAQMVAVYGYEHDFEYANMYDKFDLVGVRLSETTYTVEDL